MTTRSYDGTKKEATIQRLPDLHSWCRPAKNSNQFMTASYTRVQSIFRSPVKTLKHLFKGYQCNAKSGEEGLFTVGLDKALVIEPIGCLRPTF